MSARTLCCPASTSGRVCEASAPALRAALSCRPAHPRRAAAVVGRRRLAVAAAAADTPDWLRELEETADVDEDAARLLAGSNSDPRIVQQRMRDEVDSIHDRIMTTKYGGEESPMEVSFRGPVEQYNLWVWLELYRPASSGDLELLQEVVNSWFMLGRLGGFNSTNLQVLYHQEQELGDLEYDVEGEGAGMEATFHDMTPLEAKGSWARFWLDMGTADELALDVLINALSTFSREQMGIRQLVVGGQNDDWAVPQRDDFLPEVTMDPMRGPLSFGPEGDEDDDDEWLGDEEEWEDEDEEDEDVRGGNGSGGGGSGKAGRPPRYIG